MRGASKNSSRRKDPTGRTANAPRTALGGLLQRQECWRLSWRGWVAFSLVIFALLLTVILGVHPFLAITDRVDKEHLVVEGWIAPYAVEEALQELKAHSYARIFTTGGPVAGSKDVAGAEHYTYAQLAGSRLRKMGLARELIEMVPAPETDRDRTFTSAMALRRRFEEEGISVKAINVVTLGVHGRRTRLLYEKAFGKDVNIGVISARNREYQAGRWWKYSAGVKEVCSEGMAYLFVRFSF